MPQSQTHRIGAFLFLTFLLSWLRWWDCGVSNRPGECSQRFRPKGWPSLRLSPDRADLPLEG